MTLEDDCSCVRSTKKQDYPRSGTLFKNMNKPLEGLTKKLKDYVDLNESLYYYIVRTLDYQEKQILQKGSAPNFQGGIISLCTCKHWMRTFSNILNQESVWIAGLTSINLIPKNRYNFLFYLMRVEKGFRFKSHQEAWHNIPKEIRSKKIASRHLFGDLFKPKPQIVDEFDAESYFEPVEGHPHQKLTKEGIPIWHKDIQQYYDKPYVLLFGNPEFSFLWNKEPRFYYSSEKKLTQGQRYSSIGDFIKNLTKL